MPCNAEVKTPPKMWKNFVSKSAIIINNPYYITKLIGTVLSKLMFDRLYGYKSVIIYLYDAWQCTCHNGPQNMFIFCEKISH